MKRVLIISACVSITALITSENIAHAASKTAAEPAKKTEAANPQQDASSLSGKVVEAIDSGGYTYVNIEKSGEKIWVAVPQMKVKVGQEVSFMPGMVMSNFESKTLKRTFDSIVFSAGVAGGSEVKSGGDNAAPKKPDVAASKPVKVDKAPGPDAYKVSELFEKKDKLNNKPVVVKGQVVKFSPGIMGKNWVHIQDGSGDSSKGTNDVLFTTQDTVAVGDIVTAKGTLYKDKDFGSGYKYSVIIEDASVKK